MSVIEQQAQEGYNKTDVGVIPKSWNVVSLKEITLDMLQGINTAIDKPEYVFSGIPILKANNVIDKVVALNNADQISKRSYRNYNERYRIKKGDFLFSNIGARLGTGALWEHDTHATFAWNIMRIIPNPSKINPSFLAQLINSPHQSKKIQGEQSGSGMGFIPKSTMQKLLLPLPCIKEQTAIANALSDVDALLTELDNLIVKKQAIKTATMQQLLTGKTRLPQFATYTDDAFEGRSKGKKTSELGEIPEDWGVVPFGELFEQSISRKSLKADLTTTFVGMQDVSERARLVKQTPVIVSKVKSGFTYFERQDVLVAKITPCFENGKGCQTKQLDTEHGFGSTEFHVLRAKLNTDSDFIYFWTTRDIFRKELESEMVGSAGHRRVPLSALQNYMIPRPDTKEEQTAIATILSDMDNEIQTLEQRLTKTRQIKQGMMQQLITGRTRLPY